MAVPAGGILEDEPAWLARVPKSVRDLGWWYILAWLRGEATIERDRLLQKVEQMEREQQNEGGG